MAVCDNCGSVTARVRTTFIGARAKDECPQCCPESFDKFKAVRDGQVTMAWEYDHKHYRLKDGIPTITDEGLQDLEDLATKESEDDKLALEKAIERKRRARRTAPLTPLEIEICLARAENILHESTESV